MRVKTALGRATAGVPNGALALAVVLIPANSPEHSGAAEYLADLAAQNGAESGIGEESGQLFYAAELGEVSTLNAKLFPDAGDDSGTAFAVSPAVWNALRADRFVDSGSGVPDDTTAGE